MVVLVPSLLRVVTGAGRAVGSEMSGSETSSAQSGRLQNQLLVVYFYDGRPYLAALDMMIYLCRGFVVGCADTIMA